MESASLSQPGLNLGRHRNLDSGHVRIRDWALEPGNKERAASLTITNHQVAPGAYEARICVRDNAGAILAVVAAPRSAREVDQSEENFVCAELVHALGIDGPGRARLSRELVEGGPTFPLLNGDPETWQTELTGAGD